MQWLMLRDEYDQDMSKSSVFFPTVYATMNVSQVQKHIGDIYPDKPEKVSIRITKMRASNVILFQPASVPAVSWWQIGTDVVAMSEFHEGNQVDPHNIIAIGSESYHIGGASLIGKDFPPPDDDTVHMNDLNPAHQGQLTNDPKDGVISTTAAYSWNKKDNTLMSSRLVYAVKAKGFEDGKENIREIIAEIPFKDANLTQCQDGTPYPDAEARMRYFI